MSDEDGKVTDFSRYRQGGSAARDTFRSRIIDLPSFEGLPVPPLEWIVPEYIPHRTVTLLSGDGGIGKSLLALQLGMARALGREWIGLMPELGRTLVLSAEDNRDELHRRLDKIRQFYNASWSELADMKVVDLVGAECVLGRPMRGQIEPGPMYAGLDATLAEWKPGLVVLDVLADMFTGNECDRAQVRQFVNLLKGLCRRHDCAILLLSHPSLTGLNTGTGLSGSTDWNNAVRSRLYLETQKASDDSAQPNNLRTLKGMKANYGERGGKIDLEWKAGVFRHIREPAFLDKLAAEKKADDVFLTLLGSFNREARTVSATPSSNFAPSVFAQHADARGQTKKALRAAMDRLLKAGNIRVQTFGPPSRERTRLVLAGADGEDLAGSAASAFADKPSPASTGWCGDA
jgi:RecA-family ATPase